MSFKTTLGPTVKSLREKLKIPQDDFASKCGIGISFFRDFEEGKSNLPADVVGKMGEILGVPSAFIYVLAEGDVPERYPQWADLYRKFRGEIEEKL
jgi:transcriptional regulator with XRE-family HTH domain